MFFSFSLPTASSSESGGDTGADQAEGPSDSATCFEESEGGSGTEGEERMQAGRRVTDTSYHADGSDSDSEEGGEYAAMISTTSLAVPPSSSTITTLPVVRVPRVHASRRVSFVPGTAAPAPVSPAALGAESVDLLRQLVVGQASVLTVLHGHTRLLTQLVSFMEGMSSAISDLRRSVAAMESAPTAARYTQQLLSPPILQTHPPLPLPYQPNIHTDATGQTQHQTHPAHPHGRRSSKLHAPNLKGM